MLNRIEKQIKRRFVIGSQVSEHAIVADFSKQVIFILLFTSPLCPCPAFSPNSFPLILLYTVYGSKKLVNAITFSLF